MILLFAASMAVAGVRFGAEVEVSTLSNWDMTYVKMLMGVRFDLLKLKHSFLIGPTLSTEGPRGWFSPLEYEDVHIEYTMGIGKYVEVVVENYLLKVTFKY